MNKQKHNLESYAEAKAQYRGQPQNPRRQGDPMDPDLRGDLKDFGPSRTKQSEADACDINNIMKKYETTGILPDVNGRQPQYGDFSTMETFQEALHVVASAQSSFAQLPAEVRAQFQNDPSRFLEFVEGAQEHPDRVKDLLKMGILVEAPKDKPDPQLETLKRIDENTRKAKASAASKTKDDPE